MTTLIYVRHGQSMANLLKLYAGQKDFALTESGHRQAARIAAFLKEHYSVSRVYSSDLARAMDTARPTAKAFSLDVVPLKELRERCMGVWEGLSQAQIMEIDAERYITCKQSNIPVTPKGAETIEQTFSRAIQAEDQILSESKGKCVAVFGHSCIMLNLAKRWKESIPAFEAVFENASITVVNFDDNGSAQQIELLNYQEHLGEDATVSIPKLV